MKLKLLITSCAFAFLYMGNVDAMDPVIAQAKSMKPGPRAIFLEQKYIELNGRYVELQRQPGHGPLPDADSFADVTQGVRDIHITRTGIDDVTSYHDTFEAVHGADTIAGLIAIAARQGSGDNHAVHDGVFEEGTNYGHLREYQTLNDLRTGNGGQPYQLLSAQLRGVLDNYNTLSGFQTFEALTGGGAAYNLLHQDLRTELGRHTTLFGFQSINDLVNGGQAYQLLHQDLRNELGHVQTLRGFNSLQQLSTDGTGGKALLQNGLQGEIDHMCAMEQAATVSDIPDNALTHLQNSVRQKLQKDRLIGKYKAPNPPANPDHPVPLVPWIQPDLFQGEALHVAAGFGTLVRNVFTAADIDEALPHLLNILSTSLAAADIVKNADFNQGNPNFGQGQGHNLSRRFGGCLSEIKANHQGAARIPHYLSLLKTMIEDLTLPAAQPDQPRTLKQHLPGYTFDLFKQLLEDMLEDASFEQLGIH